MTVAKLIPKFFEGQSFILVVLAMNAHLAIFLLQDIVSLYDNYLMTRTSEFMRVIQKAIIVVIVLVSFYFFQINLTQFYIVELTVIFLVVAFLAYFFSHSKKDFFRIQGVTKGIKTYLSEFTLFCRPMVFALIYSSSITIVSNWLLLHFSGVMEQAEYGVAWQLNSLIAYTFTPIIALLQREFSVRVDDKAQLAHKYGQMLTITMLLVSYFACFVIVDAKSILTILFGEEYASACLVTRLIMLYTVLQAWGQVNGALFIATERTKLYSIINIIIQTVSLGLMFVF